MIEVWNQQEMWILSFAVFSLFSYIFSLLFIRRCWRYCFCACDSFGGEGSRKLESVTSPFFARLLSFSAKRPRRLRRLPTFIIDSLLKVSLSVGMWLSVADSRESPGGGGHLPFFLDQTEARRAKKIVFWGRAPTLSEDLDDHLYLKVWICHWLYSS